MYGQLASKEQSLLLFEMNRQFIKMKETLEPILKTRGKVIIIMMMMMIISDDDDN